MVALKRYKDILGVQVAENRFLAFHTRNLELAEVDRDVWNVLDNPAASEVQAELDAWNQSTDASVEDLKANSEVSSISFNISQICNLKCTYCGADGDGTYGAKTPKLDVSIATTQLHTFISRLKESKTFSVRFFGGEPLLYPDAIRQIANYARLMVAGRDIELIFQIVTNGTLITKENAELLAELNAWVHVSFDGDPSVNNKNRPAKAKSRNSSDDTIQGVRELLKVRDRLRYLQFNAMFGDHNMDIMGAYQFLRQFEFDSIALAYVTSVTDEKTSQIYVEKMAALAKYVYEQEGMDGLKRIAQFAEHFRLIENKKRLWDHCSGGKSGVQADTKGRLYACNWLVNDTNEAIGQGSEFNDSARAQYSEPLLEKHDCGSCWARFLCGGGCMFENKNANGDKHLKNLNFCYRVRALAAISIQYLFVESQKRSA